MWVNTCEMCLLVGLVLVTRYVERACEGISKVEIICCLKRYVP